MEQENGIAGQIQHERLYKQRYNNAQDPSAGENSAINIRGSRPPEIRVPHPPAAEFGKYNSINALGLPTLRVVGGTAPLYQWQRRFRYQARGRWRNWSV
jgi:hypothetical protein